jgi:hypothetical protein
MPFEVYADYRPYLKITYDISQNVLVHIAVFHHVAQAFLH